MRRTVAGVITLALGLMAGTAQAQSTTPAPVTFGAALGLSMPMGDAGDVLSTGFHLEGMVGFHPNMPVEFRGELMYHRFGVSGADGNTSALGIIPNVIYPFTTQSSLHPYLIGGLGLYHLSSSFGGGETDVGINVGGGLRFPLKNSHASLFAEARFHDVFTSGSSFNMFPITFGVTF